MQFLVKTTGSFGLIRDGIPLDADLTALPIEGTSLLVTTALVFNPLQDRPILPMLAYRMTQQCAERSVDIPKKPSGRVSGLNHRDFRKVG